MNQPALLSDARTALVVVDIQEKFRSSIANYDRVIDQSCKLAKAFRLLGLPVLVTEQYPEKLGATVAELTDAVKDCPVFSKLCFSAVKEPLFKKALEKLDVDTLVLCGIEAHICINQTAQHLKEAGYHVHVVVDAISSRSEHNVQIAKDKMRQYGIGLTSTEMVVLEMLASKEHPRFKEVSVLIR